MTIIAALTVTIGNPRAAGNFAPTISLETSTTRATAHPDARITIDNTASDENIKDLTLNLPDGFWGSLAAVDTKCAQADAEAGTCAETSRVGTVTASALIVDPDTGTEADGVLSGGVYLTEAFVGNNDPAGISIKVDAKVGGVDLGQVIVNGRALARNQALLAPTTPTGAVGPVRGISTIVNDIPQSVTDDNNPSRTVSYLVKKMQIDLISELGGANPPLITNPSKCATLQLSGVATPYGGGSDASLSDDYTVSQCDTTRFNPSSEFEVVNPVAGDASGLTGTINFGSGDSTLKSVTTLLPPSVGPNYPAYGAAGDKCTPSNSAFVPGGQAELGEIFNPTLCPQDAKFGKVTIETPLLPDPVVGDVYLINKTPLPWLGIDVSPASDPGNPKGITIRLIGKTDLVPVDPSCTEAGSPWGFCQEQISATFLNSPDAPVSSIELDLNRPDRPNNPPGTGTLSSKLLVIADPGDIACQEFGDFPLVFGNNSDTDDASSVNRQEFDSCGPTTPVAITSGVADGTPGSGRTTDRTPEFNFTYSGSNDLVCAIDNFESEAVPCSAPTFSYTGDDLANGIHQVFISEDTGDNTALRTVRAFVVEDDPSSLDSTAPTTTLTAGPGTPGPGVGTTTDTTPSFTFNANETSAFQCSVDGGAFLPCGDATGTDSVSYDIPDVEAFEPSDVEHSFRVRAQDEAGNVDLTPAEATFTVDVPFAPQVDVALTDTAGRGHPEMTLSVTNGSHEDLDDFSFNMPDGFFGGLTGVQSLCPVANADAGTCGAGSQVGTVEATAVVDRSTARIKGKVFLTDTRHAGDPAGLTIDVTPKLQDVTFQPVRVNARLMVRGQAQGINTVTVDIPNTTTTTIGEVSEFDIRSMVLKLKNNPAAPQPLLTNPSSCGAKSFDASFKGYDDTTATASDSVTFTGCENLGFGPQVSLAVSTRGTNDPPSASKNGIPEAVDLRATVTSNPGDAGIKDVDVLMPKPVTMNVQALTFQCSIEQQAIDACPATTRIGSATAISPLLPEAITGDIFLFKPQPGQTAATLPRLFIRLRGRINVDLFAVNRFENVTQLRSTFTNLPDVPLSSFSMSLDGFLSTRNETCSYPTNEWSATGSMVGHNGKTAGVNNPLSFNCPLLNGPGFSVSYKYAGKRGVKSRATITTDSQTGKTIKKTTITLPRGFKLNTKSLKNKKRLAKLIVVKGGSKKLSTKCFKVRSATKLEVGQCKKRFGKVTVQFKAGAFATAKKTKAPAFKVQVVDSTNKKVNAKKL